MYEFNQFITSCAIDFHGKDGVGGSLSFLNAQSTVSVIVRAKPNKFIKDIPIFEHYIHYLKSRFEIENYISHTNMSYAKFTLNCARVFELTQLNFFMFMQLLQILSNARGRAHATGYFMNYEFRLSNH